MRGIVSGVVWGLAAGATGLALVSLLAPLPAGNEPPQAPLVEAPVATRGETGGLAQATGPMAQGAGRMPMAGAQPRLPVSEGALPEADRMAPVPPRPADLPQALGAGPEARTVAASEAGLALVAEAAVAPARQVAALVLPLPEVAVDLGRPPEPPHKPAVVASVVTDLPQTGTVPAVPVPLRGAAGEEAPPQAGRASSSPVAAVTVAQGPGPAPGGSAAALPGATEAGATGSDAPEFGAIPVLPAPAGSAGPQGWDLPWIGDPPAPEMAPAQAADLPGQDGESGLPGSGSRPRVIRPGTQEGAPDAPVAAEPALVRFAAQHAAATDLPRLAVVLIDDGTLPDPVTALAALSWPVSVVIDAGRPDATAAMAAYRAAGIEVLAIIRLPAGARPSDVAVNYEAVFERLPEVIGVLDAGEGGLRLPGAPRQQALLRLAADGRGAVIAGGGLGMAAYAAAEAGVPLAVIDRRVEAAGADDAALARGLDRAAFAARQEAAAAQGGAVVLGDLRAPLLAAITRWREGRAAQEVEIVPVSAVLLAQ